MKLKLSILTILLFFLSASFPLAAQKAPQPFDIDTPSLRVFLPAPELATGRAIVACPGGGYGGLAVNHEGYDWGTLLQQTRHRTDCTEISDASW